MGSQPVENLVLASGPAASWVEKRKLGTGSYKFPTEEIMGAQNLNFALKTLQNGDFRPQILYFWQKILCQ